ncbi:MAG: prolyl oligopeptidase family serine peptidase [Vicinamibacterales bacterium]|jgi:dienelactone hydrolase
MRRIAFAFALAVSAGLVGSGQSATDTLFEKFFTAENPADAQVAADQIVVAGVDFDAAYQRLQKGRFYGDEKRGEYSLRWKSKSGPFFNNVVDVPADYDPARKWQLRVQLHGGVARPSPNAQPPGRPGAPAGGANGRAPNRIEGEKQIYLHPSGWAAAQWWDEDQIDNILRAVDALKRKYNVDEARIYITGISDGGTGVYYVALKEPNLWSSYLPLNGSLSVLRNPDNGADGEMHGNNLINAPLYVVNGENDPLYPVAQVEPHVKWLAGMGVTLTFRPQAGAVHNTAWWPTEKEPFEAFVHEHPRRAYPTALSWETERVDRFNRNRWLQIDQLRTDASRQTELKDLGFFRHLKPSGRVDIRKNANTFDAIVRDVAAFTLLLSPDAVDFGKPVIVTVNGKQVFSGAVKKDLPTLLRWAARDNDRTALYGAELKITVP